MRDDICGHQNSYDTEIMLKQREEIQMLKSLKPWWTSAKAVYDAHQLITELADALDLWQQSEGFLEEDLIQRAREAVK